MMDNVAANGCPSPNNQANDAASHNGLTWGPASTAMTATNLVVYSPTAITIGAVATIEVLDNGTNILSCAITGNGTAGLQTCTNSGTGSILPGDFLTVAVIPPATGTFASAVWRVSFGLH